MRVRGNVALVPCAFLEIYTFASYVREPRKRNIATTGDAESERVNVNVGRILYTGQDGTLGNRVLFVGHRSLIRSSFIHDGGDCPRLVCTTDC